MAMPTLIYCAGGNRLFAQIAIDAGYQFGSQLPNTVYHPVWFADQDWKQPNRAAYMASLAQQRPVMASVLDWEIEDQLIEVLDWAEEAAQYVERVMLIPKIIGRISQLPRRIGGADVVLGFSVPTRYGGTAVPSWEFEGWPVHLLGGSPHAQQRIAHYMNVVSADGNMANLMATQRCQYWMPGNGDDPKNRYWPHLRGWMNRDAPAEAFRRSCHNIMAAWRALAESNTAST